MGDGTRDVFVNCAFDPDFKPIFDAIVFAGAALSDIAGQDIHAHGGSAPAAIIEVANWLRMHAARSSIPGGQRIAREYEEFQQALPILLDRLGLAVTDVTFRDQVDLTARYVEAL